MKKSAFISFFVLFSSLAFAQWEQIGWRGGYGGYIQIQAQSGNALYGKAGTGIYKSTDWGITWKLFRNGLPHNTFFEYTDLSSSDIRITEINDKVYLSHGYYPLLSNRFYYTSGSDSTWHLKQFTPIDEWPLIHSIQSYYTFGKDSIAILHKETGSGYYHDTNGVYFSVDGGQTWEKRVFGIPRPSNPAGGYYWQLVQQGRRLIVNTYDQEPVKPYTFKPILYKTDNFGQSWEKLDMPTPDSVSSELVVIGDSLIMANVVDTELYYFSTDRGDSWFETPSPLPQRTPTVFKQRSQQIVLSYRYGAGSKEKRHLYRSLDNGLSWNRFYPKDTNLWISSLYGNDDTVVIAGSPINFITDPDFQTQTYLPTEQYGLSDYQFMLHARGDQIISVGEPADSAIIWSESGDYIGYIKLGDNDAFDYTQWLRFDNALYAVAKRKSTTLRFFYKSVDEGVTWTKLSALPINAEIRQLLKTGDHIFIATEFKSQLKYTDTAGLVWTKVDSIPAQSGSVLSCSNTLILLSKEPSNQNDYVSRDLGATWQQINTTLEYDAATPVTLIGTKLFVTTVETAPSGQSVYRPFFSTDFGNTWEQTWHRPDRKLRVAALEDGILYGVSSGGNDQLYRSLDTGKNWQQLGDSVIDARRLFIGSNYFYLAGNNELWRLPKSTLGARRDKNPTTPSILVFPNPTSNSTSITYTNPQRGILDLSIYDLLGRKHITLTSGIQDAGSHTAEWNAENTPPGVYVLRLVTSEGSATRMLQVIR